MRCVPPKGDSITNQQTINLPDKYEMVRFLGSGSFAAVYLVRHKSLAQERVLKIYHRTHISSASELTEAQLLKALSHPCIPRIYDLEEHDPDYYLYEEYIDGEPLNEFLLHQPVISTEFFTDLCDQLCSVFSYLHGLTPSPILYRDLKPEHLLLKGSTLYLIDFGIAVSADLPGNNHLPLGTPGYAAPENYTSRDLSPASDIYSIGMIMKELSAHLDRRLPRPYRAIIHKALQPDPLLRYETVEALRSAIRTESHHNTSTHLSKSIAVVGSHPGCGSTHLAVSLVSVLNYSGISAVYYEKNPNNSLRKAAETEPFMTESAGCFHYHFFHGIPFYGPGVEIPLPQSSVQVLDFGSHFSLRELEECDLILLLGTEAPWRRNDLLTTAGLLSRSGHSCRYLCSRCSPAQALSVSRLLSGPVYPYPADEKPFLVTRKKQRFFLGLLKDTVGNLPAKKGIFR